MMEKVSPNLSDVVKMRLDGIRPVLDDIESTATKKLIEMIIQANRVFVTGKGRSGLIAESFAMRLMQIGFDVHVPGEATCPRIKKDDLMIAISCSGSTTTTVQMARISQESDAKVAAVTAVVDSPLTTFANHVVLIPVTGKDLKKRYGYAFGTYNNTLFEEALLLYFDAMVYSILNRELSYQPEKIVSERHTNLE